MHCRVRFASFYDLPRLVELARLEHARSKWAGTEFDPVACYDSMLSFSQMFGRTLLCSDGGYLAGVVQPASFSRRLIALEYAWFANDGTGLALLDKFEEWARTMGAIELVVHDYAEEGKLSSHLERRRNYRVLGRAMQISL